MAQVGNRRAVINRLVQKSREEAAIKKRIVTTIDPVLKIARREYPFLSERELSDYSVAALRVILYEPRSPLQVTLAPQGL